MKRLTSNWPLKSNVYTLYISLSADAKAFPLLATVIYSVIRHTSRRVEDIVYSRTIKAENFETDQLKIEFRTPFICLPNRTRWVTADAFDRLLVIHDKPEWPKALVLDWDQLVIGKIEELWNMDLNGFYGAFVKEGPEWTFRNSGWEKRGDWAKSLPGAEQIFLEWVAVYL